MFDLLMRSLTYLLEPVGFVWALVIVAAILAFRQKKKLLGFYLVALAVVMFVLGGTPLPGAMLGSLERPFVRADWREVPACDAVVVLGGGVQPSRYEVGGLDFSPGADRVIMGLELMRLGKAPALVVSGSGLEVDGQPRIEADMTTNWLAAWNLPSHGDVISLGKCENTHDEALKTAALAKEHGWKKILLVTSAYHMRRAKGVFLTAGLNLECVACDFKTSVSIEGASKITLVPRYPGFVKLSYFVHEEIGWVMYRWRGWIRAI